MLLKRIIQILTFSLFISESLIGQGFYQNIHALYSANSHQLEESRINVLSSDSTISINDVLTLPESNFKRLDRIEKLDPDKSVWAYYQLVNMTGNQLNLIIRGGRNAKETYYIVSDSVTTIKRTGYYFPGSERDINRGYTTKIRLSLKPEKITRIYVQYDNPDGLPIDIEFRLNSASQWESKQKRLILFEGLFSGIILLIVTLNSFTFGFTKERVFLLFGAYAISNLIYFLHICGFIELLLFPDSGNTLSFLWILPLVTIGMYFFFVRDFLEFRQESLLFYRLTTILGYSCLILFGLSCVFLIATKNLYIASNFMYFFILALSIPASLLVVKAFTMKSTVSNYFGVGTSFLIVLVIIAVLNQLLYISDTIPVFVQVGIIIEVIIFSMGISHKMKKDYDDHMVTQQSLILQLTKADRIQKSKTQELEEQVADRTQRIKEQNKELIEAQSMAEKATKAKSDFLSVMSHEIRTPLNAIISLSHIMELDNQDEEMSEYIDALKFSAEGLHSLINDILDYNKIEAGKLKLENIEFSLIELVKNIRESFKYKANSKGVALQVELGEHLPDKYLGDPTRLTQVFNNLISNGIKFTEEGYVKLKVELLGIKDNMASLNFQVADTGIGIPQDRLESIFEEFEQATTATSRNYGGTGLGLSITQKLLGMMQGDIKIVSEEGKGSVFSFKLDLELCQEFDLVNLQTQDRTKDLQHKKIMVVDDNDMNRLVLKRLLDIWNASLIEVSNGKDAVTQAKIKNVDLILMDLQMQPMDGFEATELINEILPELPIIAMSANQPGDFEEDYFKTGFSSFVHKPFDPEDLFNQINKLLKSKNRNETKRN